MYRRHFIRLSFTSLLLLSSKFLMACAGLAVGTFVSMGLQLISTVLPTIPGILAAFGSLTGKTISAAQVAQLTAVFQGAADLFQQAETALNQFNANNDPTLITKIQDILGRIKSSLSSVLPDLQIKDVATLAKISSVVNSFIDLANNILTILPQVINGKLVARKVSKAQMAKVTPEGWSARFNESVGKPTGNNEVDLAFSNVRATVAPARP